MSVLDYLVHTPVADPCEGVKFSLADALVKLDEAQNRTAVFAREQDILRSANEVLGRYIMLLVIAFIAPGITRTVEKIALASEVVITFVFFTHMIFANMLDSCEMHIRVITVVAAVSSMINAYGIKDGSLILPTDPITAGHKLYSDWQSGQNLTLVRANTSDNVVRCLETANGVFALYMVALCLAFSMSWVSEAIRMIARFNLEVSKCLSQLLICLVALADCIIAYVQGVVLFCVVNNLAYNWCVSVSSSHAYLEAAVTVYKVANEETSSFGHNVVQGIIAHLWSNSVERA